MADNVSPIQPDDDPLKATGAALELAPSLVRADEPTVARWVGMIGAMFVVFGGTALLFNLTKWWDVRIGTGLSLAVAAVGMIGLLAHAAYDGELQVRRVYWGGGMVLLLLGIILCFVPGKFSASTPDKSGYEMLALFEYGYPCLGLALAFVVAVLRHETDREFRRMTLFIIGAVGAVGTLLAFVLGNNFGTTEFFLPYGILLALMGLVYLTVFVNQMQVSSDLGYRAALLIGALGAIGLLTGLLRSILASDPYLVPWGLTQMALGLLFLGVSAAMCLDLPIVVMFRRELAAFFFSPLFYLILFGLTVIAYFNYRFVLAVVFHPKGFLPEPIIQWFVGVTNYLTVICVVFVVPVLTMRVLSEEKRSGTLEVLLTAPVRESSVVLSKFLATWLVFMLVWTPWWFFLIALRIGSGESFEYNPVFSFLIVQGVTGAAFVGIGLFFSSLTSNQVASAVMTFGVMLVWTGIGMIKGRLVTADSSWYPILHHIDYMYAWEEACKGLLLPRALLFFPSVAILSLYATTKVMESRRWA